MRRNKLKEPTQFEHAANITSLARHMGMPDVSVEFSWGWGGLYRVHDGRANTFAFFDKCNDAAANVIAKARVRNASKIYRTGSSE